MKCSTRVRNVMKVFWCLLTMIFLMSCAADLNNTKDKSNNYEKWGTLAEESQGHSPAAQPKKVRIAEQVSKQSTAAAKLSGDSRKLPSTPVNLTMRQAELKAVLRAMAKSVNLNLLLKNDLKGEISVDFRGVPWDKAFVGLLQTHGLSYMWEGNILLVKTPEDIEQDLKQKMQMRDIQWVEPLLQPVIINIDYADAKKLSDMLQDFLTKDKDGKPRGSVKVDEHTNALLISAMRNDLEKMLPIIEKIDRPTPQVLIKANIVETSKSVARDLGILWGGRYNTGDYTAMGGGTRTATGAPINPTAGGPVGIGGAPLVSNFGAANLTDTAAGSLALILGAINGNVLEIQLQALQKDGKLNIISSPSITTLDNQKAFTENGERVPFITYSGTGLDRTATTTFENVVMRLEITPHVVEGRNLKMNILVKKDEVDTTRKSALGDPYIIKKETQTVLMVKDGETIVISGLTKQRSTDGNSGWPWLKDIPALGYLFKADGKSESMEEVLIFITPKILPVAKIEQH